MNSAWSTENNVSFLYLQFDRYNCITISCTAEALYTTLAQLDRQQNILQDRAWAQPLSHHWRTANTINDSLLSSNIFFGSHLVVTYEILSMPSESGWKMYKQWNESYRLILSSRHRTSGHFPSRHSPPNKRTIATFWHLHLYLCPPGHLPPRIGHPQPFFILGLLPPRRLASNVGN